MQKYTQKLGERWEIFRKKTCERERIIKYNIKVVKERKEKGGYSTQRAIVARLELNRKYTKISNPFWSISIPSARPDFAHHQLLLWLSSLPWPTLNYFGWFYELIETLLARPSSTNLPHRNHSCLSAFSVSILRCLWIIPHFLRFLDEKKNFLNTWIISWKHKNSVQFIPIFFTNK